MGTDHNSDYNKKLVNQLRAGGLDVAERAEEIVGSLTGTISMSVTITIGTNTDHIIWPQIDIHRAIVSHPMAIAMISSPKNDDPPRITLKKTRS